MKTKLSVEQVAQIRQQCEYGRKPSVIAKEFGITVQHLWKIRNGRVWKAERAPSPFPHRSEEYRAAQDAATKAVAKAVESGVLPDLRKAQIMCVDCKVRRATEYEHRDYSQPLKVEPTCHRCNLIRGEAQSGEKTSTTKILQPG